MSINYERVLHLTEDDFDGSSPAPLLISGPERVDGLIDRQDLLADNFHRACFDQLDTIVKRDVVQFAANGIRNRMHQREGQNAAAYMKRLYENPNYSLSPEASTVEIDQACEAAKYGGASLAQAALAATVYGMSSWEGKNLTIIDTFRRNLEAPMWEEVSELVDSDARPTFDTMRNFKVHQFVGRGTKKDPIRAMRIEMKRTIGESIPGTTIKARTIAALNTAQNPQLFSRYDLNTIHDAWKSDEDLSDNQVFLDIARRLVDNTLDHGIVLARNETVYGHNAEVERAQDERRLDAQRKEFEHSSVDYYNPHIERL